MHGVAVVVVAVLVGSWQAVLASSSRVSPSEHPNFEPSVDWAHLTTAQIIQENGYNCETHEVTTQDGYILQMHRIPPTKSTHASRPILVHHCLLCASSVFVMNTPDKALAYILADAGYDVWLANARGNTYSKRHTYLSTDDKEFWDFSWHEIGKYDLPVEIDHILKETNRTQLGYLGFSMGTTVFWVLMSERPAYREKIQFMVGLGPVAFVQHLRGTLRYAAPFVKLIERSLSLAGRYEMLSFGPRVDRLTSIFCNAKLFTSAICQNFLFLVAGPNPERLNKKYLPVLLAHTPAGTSVKTIAHYLQLVNSGSFRQYDNGKLYNLAYYSSLTPPAYDLSGVTCPVALFYSSGDWLATPEDVNRLRMLLPNVVLYKEVEDDAFGHLDFVWANDGDVLVYEDVLNVLKRYY